MMSKALVWFRNDLRISDNEALFKASKIYQVIPVFVFDERNYILSDLGFTKTGPFKTRFLIESVQALRNALISLGSNLIIKIGIPEDIIPALATSLGAQKVYASKEVNHEETQIEKVLELTLFKNSIPIEFVWQSTLFHEQDVPWPVKQVPEVFTVFRKETENTVTVRPLFHKPTVLTGAEPMDFGALPKLSDFGLEEVQNDARSVLSFVGGEHEAQNRMQDYFWKKDGLKTYKETRNGLIGADYSSKLSPWLAIGALSAKCIYYEVKKYEQERHKNNSTYWMIFELLWRDFFKFMGKKHGYRIFLKNGLSQLDYTLDNNHGAFKNWRLGQTQDPFINANMNELRYTGFMSNRGRQIVASYLIYQLKVNWTWGAAWFEHALIDYDASSNWLNWAYIAGVGNDPRNGREFNIESQRLRHDPEGEYVKMWN